jgi:hypothetical protein
MSSLSQLYKSKDKNGTETTVKKTFLVPLSEIYVEPGFNVRESTRFTSKNFATRLLLASTSRLWLFRLPSRV